MTDRKNVVRSMANPFEKPSWPSAFQPYSRSPGMPNMDTRSHYFPPVVGDPVGESRYMTHGSRPPSRRKSQAFSRASSRLSGVDMSWLGPYMTKLADDNIEREKRILEEARRLSDEANLREQRMLEESHANLELMKKLLRERESAALAREQLNYEREEKQQTLASRREETIRQDMRQQAAIEARAAALQQQLRAEQLKPSKLTTVDTIWPTERPTSRTSLDTDPCISLSSQGGYPVVLQSTADLSRSTLSTVGYTSSTVASCVTTLSTDTTTVSSDKYPCVVSAPLVSQQHLGTTGESNPQFTQSLATATGQTVSHSLTLSASHEIAGLINVTAGQSHSITSAAGTPQNSVASNQPVIPLVCVPNVTSTPVTTVGSLNVSSAPTQPVIVVNTPQIVRPYNGSTSWTSFRDHFKRVATVNRWEDDTTRAQHLMLALEGTAAEVLKEINDTSPTVYQDIWKALSRRFGEVDEVRESMRKFENCKQLDSESVVEYEQALRNLYRLAWP